ncbi:hypothetical protein BV921_19035 [Pectobacterium odoriferum]|nr:hypothetical protein BV921_19035 [Pectobacterium odoriferum]TKY82189.1 hypothetical protein EDI29_12545 [Pectobacterium polonicum]
MKYSVEKDIRMPSTAKNRAYQRGLKAAGVWQHVKNTLKHWDATCIALATRFHLPTWIGHIPVAALCVLSATSILFGGFIIAGVALFLWALILLSPQKGVVGGQALNDSNYWWWWKSK